MFNVTDFLNTAFSGSSVTSEKDKLQRKLRNVLQDDSIQILSSFELNQWATLTYHEGQHSAEDDLCEAFFELLQSLFLHPTQQSTLTLQKALVVARHVLLVGAEKVMQEAQILKPAVAALRGYNTALIQQQQQSANVWLRFKGGTVDEGGPVRELAEGLFALLSMPRHDLLREREKHADPTSLVPIGSNQEIAFATDAQRLQYLQQRMQLQERMQQKSNLAKADNGFGGGFSSRDGQSIVGASHSLEEMMENARRKEAAKQAQFRDEPSAAQLSKSSRLVAGFADYETPLSSNTPNDRTEDLLDCQNNHTNSVPDAGTESGEAIDLLDFGETTSIATSKTNNHSSGRDDLLSLVTISTEPPNLDPFAPAPNSWQPPVLAISSQNVSTMTTRTITSTTTALSNDPFSAFDTLGPSIAPTLPSFSHANSSTSNAPSGASALNTMNVSMAFMGISDQPHPVAPPTTTTPSIVSSSLRVAWAPANHDNHDDDENNSGGFVMGGAAGSGLEPLGSAPAAPPPPPPSSFY
ncbi:hypothetical protein FisN_21Lh010 [Fistulifera solaris]|uniref:ENTH domain-containing protein n=1 Tax=Fistulifera solaris TaxID=1519565 RepID=A0A1Z5JB55_FISSO|nr:hypothetical protein FisN_21Lh010 [Fistulifera solaris]|eukprot:GAX11048.1 hypothetical protein FisN_21Lh010 [Fistulifera solaris]